MDTHIETSFDAEQQDDGTMIIRKMVWVTPVSGRGREHAKATYSTETWNVGTPEDAYGLVTDLIKTLAFYTKR